MNKKFKDVEEYLQKLCDEETKLRPFEEVWKKISVIIKAEKNLSEKEKNNSDLNE